MNKPKYIDPLLRRFNVIDSGELNWYQDLYNEI